MTKCVDLSTFVDFLTRIDTDEPEQEWYFVDGKLYLADVSGHAQEVEHVAESQILDRPVVMKRISENVKSNVEDFLKASNCGSHNRYDAFAKEDIESIGGYFSYFADWSKEAAKVLRFEEKIVHVNTALCLILSDCPIYSTLSRFVASNYAAGKNIQIYVDKKYLIPALSFARFLCGSGFRNDEISVFSSTHASFPKNNSFHESVNGVIPIEFPFTTVKDLSKNTRSNIYFKRHSVCPVLVLKSADIDSVVKCLTKSTRDQEALWIPNVVYVEEPVYKIFLDTLKFAVNTANQCLFECLNSTRQERLNALLSEKNNEGYEVVTLHFLFHSCIFVVNYEFTLLDPSKTDGYHFISILPVRHTTEGVYEMNKQGGLCASIWTNDTDLAMSVPFDLNYGTIWVNRIGVYNPAVPLSMWNSQGAGTISGKRMLFEQIESSATKIHAVDERSYGNERYTRLPKRTLSESLELSFGVLKTWSKLFTDDRLHSMEAAANAMIDKNLDKQSKISLNPIPDKVWEDCEGYLRGASVVVRTSGYEEYIHARNYMICCKCEPVGVIAILAGTIPLDELFFYIAVALINGNVVIVGMSTDQQSSIVAHEFEQVFPKSTVTVMIGSRDELWQQFTTASSISSVWFRSDADSPSSLASKVHHQTIFNMGVTFNSPVVAKLMMSYATKMKCVWFPRTNL